MKPEHQQKEPSDTPQDRTGVVVPFPVRKASPPPPTGAFSNLSSDRPLVDDLDKYAKRGTDQDDYPHRMKMNALALIFLAALVGGGLWIVEVMAQQRKNQDCVLSGRRNCATIAAPTAEK